MTFARRTSLSLAGDLANEWEFNGSTGSSCSRSSAVKHEANGHDVFPESKRGQHD